MSKLAPVQLTLSGGDSVAGAQAAAACHTAIGVSAQTWLEFVGGQAAKGVPSEHGNVGSVDHDQNTIDIQGVST